MKIKILVEIEIPDESTHYTGDLADEHNRTFYKKRLVVGVPYWLYWCTARQTWIIHGEKAPHFVEPIAGALDPFGGRVCVAPPALPSFRPYSIILNAKTPWAAL